MAASPQAIAARMNEITTAGPALSAACLPVSTKMPVPMMTPTPKTVRSQADRLFLSLCSGSSVSLIDCSTDLVRNSCMSASRLRAAARLAVAPPGET